MKYPRLLAEEMYYDQSELMRRYDPMTDCSKALLGIPFPNPADFDHSLTGFGKFLKACDVGRYFKPREICTPHDLAKAAKVGYKLFLPPLWSWPWVALVVGLADGCRRVVGQSVSMRNLWRPYSYNKLVAKSSIKSDHPNACGADLDFKTQNDRRKAEGYIRGVHAALPDLEISLGMGARVLHVGVLSPDGSRSWYYANYRDAKVRL